MRGRRIAAVRSRSSPRAAKSARRSLGLRRERATVAVRMHGARQHLAAAARIFLRRCHELSAFGAVFPGLIRGVDVAERIARVLLIGAQAAHVVAGRGTLLARGRAEQTDERRSVNEQRASRETSFGPRGGVVFHAAKSSAVETSRGRPDSRPARRVLAARSASAERSRGQRREIGPKCVHFRVVELRVCRDRHHIGELLA